MTLEEQIIKVIMELRVHGLANGGTIGYHAGWCDDAADRLADARAYIRELTEENKRLKANEIMAVEEIEKLEAETKRLESLCVSKDIIIGDLSKVRSKNES